MTKAESNRRYYDRNIRKYHAGKLAPLCNQRGVVAKDGPVTCRTCLMVQRSKVIGKQINEWEQKRLVALFRAQSRERSAAWRRANPEKAREAARRWRSNNRDLHRLSCREWYQKNREVKQQYNAHYNANVRSQS
jgi:hypothetical protein